ncbi:MAG: nitrous oxide reductase accessory protein NosL [Thiobacillus sp.]|nr:nitrous oxide reductase accessory protein NosL [Thiobacillus sp.]
MLAIAVAVAAVVLLPHGERAASDPDLVTNELCIVAPATPYDPASGLAMLAPRPIPAAARCPVCGMYPARFPRWAAQSIFRDGAAHYFDSPIDLFVFLQKVDRYDSRYGLNEVAVSFVTDFETGQWIEAQDAFFVHGSSAFGPMRDADLPAFASREAADALTRSRGGRVLAFTEVTPELIQSLNRSVHHRH